MALAGTVGHDPRQNRDLFRQPVAKPRAALQNAQKVRQKRKTSNMLEQPSVVDVLSDTDDETQAQQDLFDGVEENHEMHARLGAPWTVTAF